MSEPYYRADRDGWYVYVEGPDGKRKRKFLAKAKRTAFSIWKAGLAAGAGKAFGDPLFSTVAAKWLARQLQRQERGEVSETWVNRVSRTIEAFQAKHPRIKCSQLHAGVAVDWLPKGSSLAYERTEAGTLKQILGWAVGKYIDASPLADMKLEKGNRRETLISLAEHRRLLRADRLPRFRALLRFAWWTGARPSELRLLRWEQVSADCSRATLKEHKTKRKVQRPRVIYFNPVAQRMLKRHRQTNGPVFINSRGKPWTKDAIVRRMNNLQEETGIAVSAYTYRHSFITRALIRGEDVATVAELTGTSVEMISRNYGHLDKARSHLAEVAKRMR